MWPLRVCAAGWQMVNPTIQGRHVEELKPRFVGAGQFAFERIQMAGERGRLPRFLGREVHGVDPGAHYFGQNRSRSVGQNPMAILHPRGGSEVLKRTPGMNRSPSVKGRAGCNGNWTDLDDPGVAPLMGVREVRIRGLGKVAVRSGDLEE
jgi:hypothetical protein